jgi:aminoglycoside phosphotransferase (APT) family kinase protein
MKLVSMKSKLSDIRKQYSATNRESRILKARESTKYIRKTGMSFATVCMGERRYAYRMLVRKPERKVVWKT